jgi:hypothetical protein
MILEHKEFQVTHNQIIQAHMERRRLESYIKKEIAKNVILRPKFPALMFHRWLVRSLTKSASCNKEIKITKKTAEKATVKIDNI